MSSGDRAAPKCHVCSSVFQFGGPEPLLLPCLHSVCQICIAFNPATVDCSSCKQSFLNDDSFPKDAVQAKSIFLTTLTDTPSEVRCTNRNDDKKALHWCPQCEALLCGTCEETHKDMKLTKNHEVKSLASLLKDQEGIEPKTSNCPHHGEQNLSLYDGTCDALICYKCRTEDHSRCDVTSTDAACSEFKDTYLPDAMTKLEAKKAAIASVEEEATCLSNRLGPRVETVKRAIKRSFDDMAASLNKRREEMDLQTDSCFKEVEENNKKRLEELKLEKVRLEATLDLCRSSQGLSFPPQLLSMKSTMIGRVDECLERELPKVSKTEADINFSNKDEEDLLEIIPSSGVLYSSWTQAAYTLQPLQGILSQTRRQLKTCTRDKRAFQEQLRRRNEELVNTREILSDTRNQLNVCLLAKELTQATLHLRSEELDKNKGTLSKTRAELRQSQEKRRHCEQQLGVCVEKMRNATSLIENASFKFTFQPKFYGPLVSSKKVLKTIPWFVEVEKNIDLGAVSCYLKVCNGMLNKSAQGWACRMKATCRVETSHGEPISSSFEYDFTNNSHGYGFPELIRKGRLQETTGTIKLRVDVEARESRGLVPLEDRLRKEFNETLATLRR